MPLKHPVQATVKHGEYHNVKFSAAEDDDLVQYLATYSAAALGRSSRDLYDVLGQHASDKFAWSRHRQAASWRSRYANNKKTLDMKIDAYKLREMETPHATGVTSTHVVPSISKPKAPTVTAPTTSAASATEAKKRKRPTDEDISTTSQLSVTAAADTATVLHPPVKRIKVFPVSATKVPLPTHASDSGNVPRLDLSQMQRTPAPMTPAHFPFASGSTSHTSTPKMPAPLPVSSGSTRTFDSGPQSTSTPYRPWENVSESSLLNAMATLSGKPITPELAAEAAAHVAALRPNGSQLHVGGAKLARSQAKSRSGPSSGPSSSLLEKAKAQSQFNPGAVAHPAPISPPPTPFSDDDLSLRFDSTPPPTPPPAPTEGQRRPLPLVVHIVKPRRRREKPVPVKENNGGGPAVTPPPNLHPPMNNDGGLASTSTSESNLNIPTNKPVPAATATPTANEPSSASTPIASPNLAADAESVQKPSPTLHAALTELVAKSFFTVDRVWQAYIAVGRCMDAIDGPTNTKHASATRMERTTILLEDMEMAALNVRWETLQVNRSQVAGAGEGPKSGEGEEEEDAKPKEKKEKRKRENAEDLKEDTGPEMRKKKKRKQKLDTDPEEGRVTEVVLKVDAGPEREKRKKNKKDHDERNPPEPASAEPSMDAEGKGKRKRETREDPCDVVDAAVELGVDCAPPPPPKKKKKKSKKGEDAVGSVYTDGDRPSREKTKKDKKDGRAKKEKSKKHDKSTL